MKQRKVAVVGDECVSCGNCVNYCPVKAIHISRGIRAVVDGNKCVGCGKCVKACPAGVIELFSREVNNG